VRNGLAVLATAAVAATLLLTAAAAGVERTFAVRLDDGRVVEVTLDLPADQAASTVSLPGELVAELTPSESAPPPPHVAADPPGEREREPAAGGGRRQRGERGHRKPRRLRPRARPRRERSHGGGRRPARRRAIPPARPQALRGLPGPSGGSIPDFVIRKFRVPVFLLPIYQAAGTQYGIRWEILAAINEIESPASGPGPGPAA
jgi:hypothetical protein